MVSALPEKMHLSIHWKWKECKAHEKTQHKKKRDIRTTSGLDKLLARCKCNKQLSQAYNKIYQFCNMKG